MDWSPEVLLDEKPFAIIITKEVFDAMKDYLRFFNYDFDILPDPLCKNFQSSL